jgi:hypothetical protein
VPTPIIINVNLFPKLYINCPNQEWHFLNYITQCNNIAKNGCHITST